MLLNLPAALATDKGDIFQDCADSTKIVSLFTLLQFLYVRMPSSHLVARVSFSREAVIST